MKQRSSISRVKVSVARAAAFDILLRVEQESAYASELLHSPAYNHLPSIDHALATELVMGVLRWRSLLDGNIAGNTTQAIAKLDREILIALRMAVYQLGWLSRVPARAAINESVELVKRARKRSAVPFVNAVLRKLAHRTNAGGFSVPVANFDSAEAIANGTAHPLWLVRRWIQAYGLQAAQKICRHDQCVPVTAIRLRAIQADEQLRNEGCELAPGALLASARRVLRGDVTKTSAFLAGLCVIQDEGSQLVAALVGEGEHILDCCAAPGGKTLFLADRNPNADIIAVELHAHRARLMKKLITAKSPVAAGAIRVLSADARSLPFADRFDRVLADVPCSGTGTLARNPEIKWRLTSNDLADLQARQVAILTSAMGRVAAGGRVLYSTCSLEPEENEDVVEKALGENSSFRVVDCSRELARLRDENELSWPDISSLTRGPYLRTIPGIHPCDGFFAAILERI